MAQEFAHVPVLAGPLVAALQPHADGVYIDATLGGGGHTRLLLQASRPTGRVIAIDRDEDALDNARRWCSEAPADAARLTLVHANFADLADIVTECAAGQVDGIMADLGVSSFQFDVAYRGFSYQHDAPLDMRMDRTRGRTAAELLASSSVPELERIIRVYGEERFAGRIAQAIARRQRTRAIETTGDLADVVKQAIPAPARRTGPHPARRTFMALRIAVNDELAALQSFLTQVPDALRPGGRVAIISFHSLEDRMVKQAFNEWATDCICPPQVVQCVCGHRAQMKIIARGGIVPGPEEVENNPRARSARLRIAQKLDSL
jgi:16S rRNA (cytosine1402-N4)-methyltransferase